MFAQEPGGGVPTKGLVQEAHGSFMPHNQKLEAVDMSRHGGGQTLTLKLAEESLKHWRGQTLE